MSNLIRVFEHEKLTLYSDDQKRVLTPDQLDKLIQFNTDNNNKYFTVIHKGIKFSQYVGVIQVGDLTIEILPKADKSYTSNKDEYIVWRDVLLDMLCISNRISVDAVHEANLQKRQNSILDLYFNLFIAQLEILIRRGLFKKYKSDSSNLMSFKGRLNFSKNIQHNIIRKDRFYTTHQEYSYDHTVNQILSVALNIIDQISHNHRLLDKTKQLISLFPEQSNIKVQESTFAKIRPSRKLKPYHEILKIAEIIILNFSPEIQLGGTKLLALLFDMNMLWESYIYMMLAKVQDATFIVKNQQSQKFWNNRKVRPDIVINFDGQPYVIDTKWKIINDNHASDDDLKQLYVYNMYWNAPVSMLLYPSNKDKENIKGSYHKGKVEKSETNICIISYISVLDKNNKLDRKLGDKIKSIISKSIFPLTEHISVN